MAETGTSRWEVHYELRVELREALLREIRSRLIDVAESLAGLIHPMSPFWTSEQGLRLDVDGWAVDYRVDLEIERVTVTGAVRSRLE